MIAVRSPLCPGARRGSRFFSATNSRIVLCDLNVIGIDFMCADIGKPAEGQAGAGVIEVNASPGLRAHHVPVSGKPRNVAGEILRMVLAALDRKRQ